MGVNNLGANNIAIDAASLKFQEGAKEPLVTNSFHGTYSIELTPGEYLVTISADGFCQRSKDLSIKPGEGATSSDFTLMDCSDCDLRNIDFDSQVPTDVQRPIQAPNVEVSNFKYKREHLEGLQLDRASEILFGTREESGSLIVYGSLPCPGWPQRKPAIYTNGRRALGGFTLTLSRDSHVLRADGKVVQIDESGIKRATSAELRIQSGEFRVLSLK